MLKNKYLNSSDYSKLKIKLDEIISYEPGEIINNLDKINKNHSNCINEIFKEKNEIIEIIIIDILENKFLMYFNCIKNLDDNTKEKLFPKYFRDLKHENLILFDLSLKLFKQQINFLDKISYKIDDEKTFDKLYSVTFVKLYLFKFVGFTKNNLSEIEFYREIFQIINDTKNKNFKKVVLIYILKLYYYYLDNNMELLKYLSNNILSKIFDDEFSCLFNNEDAIISKFYLLPLEKDKYEKYLQNLKEFENIKRDKFSAEEKIKQFILNLLNHKDLDIFIIITINKIFFEIYSDNEDIKIGEYKNFLLIVKEIINANFKDNPELIKLLNLFYDSEIYSKNIFPQIKNKKLLEILLYGFHFCVQTLYTENEISLENQNYKNKINEKCFYNHYFQKIIMNL